MISGNLFSRVLTMAHKYFAGRVPETNPSARQNFSRELESGALETTTEFERDMEKFAFHRALASIWNFINQLNKYIDVTAPWELAKKKTSRPQLEIVIYNLLEGLRVVSGLIYPVMPDTAAAMQTHLGLNPEKPFYLLKTLRSWNVMKSGTVLPKSITLFPRIDPNQMALVDLNRSDPPEQDLKVKPEISLEDFSKVDLRVATVLHAEPVPRANKLLKLELDMGEKRTIVAGISRSYPAADLIGRQIIVVANLKPAKIMGILSNGMLLAASDRRRTAVATLEKEIKPGTPLS